MNLIYDKYTAEEWSSLTQNERNREMRVADKVRLRGALDRSTNKKQWSLDRPRKRVKECLLCGIQTDDEVVCSSCYCRWREGARAELERLEDAARHEKWFF